MRIRWTIVLIIINAFLIWMVGSTIVKPATQRTFESKIRSFLPLQGDEWDMLGVSTSDGEWSAKRDSWGRWWLKEPIEWPGRYERFSKMIAFLTTLKIDSVFSAHQLTRVGQSLSSYGLDKPQAIIEIGSGSKNYKYKVGIATPLGEKLYVLSPSQDEVWVVDRELLQYVDPAFESYRKDGFFPFDIVELEGVSVMLGDVEMTLQRKTNSNSWQVVFEKESFGVESGVWENYLEELSSQNITDFQELDASVQGLKTPAGRLIFKTLYGRRALLIGGLADAQHRWVQWEGAKNVFTLPVATLDQLRLSNFVAEALLNVDVDSVESIEWTQGSQSVLVNKKDGFWFVGDEATQQEADEWAVRKYLLYLSSLKTEPFLKKTEFLTSAPKLVVKTDKERLEYRFSSDFKLAGSGSLHYRFESAFEPLVSENLLDKRMAEFPEGDPERIELQTVVGEVALDVQTPVASAALALLEEPVVKRWLDDVVIPSDASSLILTWGQGNSYEIFFWRDSGWIGAINQKGFEPTPEWNALFENASRL